MAEQHILAPETGPDASPETGIEQEQERSSTPSRSSSNDDEGREGILAGIGKQWKGMLTILGGLALFSVRVIRTATRPPYEFREIIRQLNAIGWRSMSLISVVGVVIGAVLTMQSRPTMVKFGAEA